jgi:hypothetical protein
MSTRTVRVWDFVSERTLLWEYLDSTLTAENPPNGVHVDDINAARKDAGLPKLPTIQCSKHGLRKARNVHVRLNLWGCPVCLDESSENLECYIPNADGTFNGPFVPEKLFQ